MEEIDIGVFEVGEWACVIGAGYYEMIGGEIWWMNDSLLNSFFVIVY